MKILAVAILAVFLSISSFAQTQKVTIYAWVDQYGHTDYGDLSKWLPDSTQKEVFVTMKRNFHVKKGNVIMVMNLHGWKLAGTEPEPGIAGNGPVSTSGAYLFSRDIDVDDKTKEALNGVLETSLHPK